MYKNSTFNLIHMKKKIQTICALAICMIAFNTSYAFCGFYVAKADAKLFNNKSEVIMVRNGTKNVITMSSDFQGNLKDFAMVVPVPVVLKKEDIRVVERRLFDALNDYSAPRVVEYYDANPCGNTVVEDDMTYTWSGMAETTSKIALCSAPMDFGVTIEAQYEIEEYDILILSATESNGLKNWLILNGYSIPTKAEEVLEPYIKSNMKFFVVKVNLDKMKDMHSEYLRPLQLSFDHKKFMLPLRLGMANSQGSQDMIVYAFTKTGRVECTNYRTVKLPTDRNIPLYIQAKFGDFYKALFEKSYVSEGRNAVFLEYAWNVSPYNSMHCDPCVGPPPVNQDFTEAGVDWLYNTQGQTIFFTRLHVRYSRNKFPADLQFQETPNNENFQCRYILTHPANGDLTCDAGQEYLETLYNKRTREVDEVSALTGWSKTGSESYLNEYTSQMNGQKTIEPKKELFPIIIKNFKVPIERALMILVLLSILSFVLVKGKVVKNVA